MEPGLQIPALIENSTVNYSKIQYELGYTPETSDTGRNL